MVSVYDKLAVEVILGKWGNGADRRAALTDAGHDYERVQRVVNAMCAGTWPEHELDALTVELDLAKYNGLNIIIKGGPTDGP